MAEIFHKNINGMALDPVEVIRLQGRCYRDLRHWENIFYQVREEMISEDEWEGFRNNLMAILAVPAYQESWEAESSLYSKAFQNEIAAILRDYHQDPASQVVAARFKVQPTDDHSTDS